MTKTQVRMDIGDAVNNLAGRVRVLESTLNGPDVMGNTDPDAVHPPDIPDLVDDYLKVHTISPITPAPGQTDAAPLGLAPGAYMDDIFIDVSWGAPVDNSAATYEVEMAKQTAPGVFALADLKDIGGTSVRFRALEPNTTYGFRVTAVNFYGVRAGPSPATYQTVSTGKDTTVPPQVTNVIIGRGATSVVVKFTPLSSAQAADVASGRGEYQIQISTDSTFGSVLGDVFTNDQIYAFDGIIGEGYYYARVRAIDESGNVGAWSAVAGPALAGSVNDSMMVADLNAAKITVGFLNASRLQAGTITADKLTAGSLGVGADIGIGNGSIRIGNPPTNGMWLNSQGLRAYYNSAVQFALDSSGNATFSGAVTGATISGGSISGITISGSTITGGLIRTAVSGRRIEISATDQSATGQASGTVIAIQLYGNSTTTPGELYALSDAFGNEWVELTAGNRGWAAKSYLSLETSNVAANSFASLYSSGDVSLTADDQIRITGANNGFYTANVGTTFTFQNQVNVAVGGNLSSNAGGTDYLANISARVVNSGSYDHYAAHFNPSSSIKIKRNVKRVPEGQHKSVLMALRPVSFNRLVGDLPPDPDDRRFESEEQFAAALKAHSPQWSDREEIGFVAEEVEQILPSAVFESPSKIKSLDYFQIVALLVRGYQDLEQRVTQLEGAR